MPPAAAAIAARDDPFPLLLTATPPVAPPLSPTVTPAAVHQFGERQSIVTVSVTSTAQDSGPTSGNGNKFPVAVAVPALVGGAALACIIAGLWWWISIKRDKEKKRNWEAAQRRKRRRAESAAARKAEMSRRNTAVTAFNAAKTPNMSEKDDGFIPPVPALPTLPKAASTPAQDQYASAIEEGYNHYASEESDAPAYDAYGGYSTQPNIDEVNAPVDEKSSSSRNKPDRPSRSTARMAAAENAAAREQADPNTRWKPNKPSRFAKEAGPRYDDGEEMLADGDYRQGGGGKRQVSGEWGVALGSPNSDSGFSNASSQPLGAHYLNDPYLNGSDAGQRAPSGQYSTDPYAMYHDPTTKKTASGWV